MAITVSLRALLDAQPALQRLASEKLPIKTAYQVARMVKALQPELDEFYKQRNDLVKEFGIARPATEAERATHGDEVTEVPREKLDEFRKILDELVGVIITVERTPLALSEALPAITPADLVALGPFIEEWEEPVPAPAPPVPSSMMQAK